MFHQNPKLIAHIGFMFDPRTGGTLNYNQQVSFGYWFLHGGFLVVFSYLVLIFGTGIFIRLLFQAARSPTKTKIIVTFSCLAVLAAGILIFFGKNNRIQDKIYVAAEGDGQIVSISAKDRTVIDIIDLAEEIDGRRTAFMPHNVQVAPDNKTVWVTANVIMNMGAMNVNMGGMNMGMNVSDEVVVIDPLADKIIKRIKMGVGLHLSHVVLIPDSSYAIAISQTKGVIYKINAKTYEVEKEINTEKNDDQPHGLRISPDGRMAYIAMLGGKSLGILDIGKMSLSYVPLKGAAIQSGVTLDGKYALASVFDAKSLAVYEIASQKLSYVDLPKNAKGPVQIYPTPDSRYVYVADQGYFFNQPAGDSIYKVDLQKMKVVQIIQGGNAPHGVVVSRDGKFVYVTNSLGGDVSILDADKGKEIARIKTGRMPNGVSLFYSK